MQGRWLWRWRKGPRAKDHERLWKLEKDSPLKPPEGIQPSRHPDLRTYDPQSSQILSLCCLKPPNPWRFITATMGHSYRPEETQPLQVIAKGPRTPSGCTCLTEHLLCARHLAKLQRHNSYLNGSQPRPPEQSKQKHEEGIRSTLRTKPQLSPTCGSRDSEVKEAGCLMANALVRTHSGGRRAGVTHTSKMRSRFPTSAFSAQQPWAKAEWWWGGVGAVSDHPSLSSSHLEQPEIC